MLPKHVRKGMFLALSSIILAIFATFSPLKALAQIPTNTVSAAAWSPNGNQLAVGMYDSAVQIWDTGTKQLVNTLKGHTKGILSLSWSPDGSKLVSGSLDTTARIWDVTTGQLIAALEGHNEEVRSVAWSPDGKQIASGGSEQNPSLIIWDAVTGKRLLDHSAGSLVYIVWSPKGDRLALAVGEGIDILNATTLERLSYIEATDDKYGTYTVAWSADGQWLVSGSYDGTVRVWHVATGKVTAAFHGSDIQAKLREDRAARSVAFSADGLKVLSANADGTIRTWDLATGKTLMTVQQPNPIYAASWSIYGSRLAFGYYANSNTILSPEAMDTIPHIIVPFPSVDELQALTKRCTKRDVQPSLIAKLDAKQLSAFTSAVQVLTRDQIPPACAADLIAVAEALQAKP